MMAIGKTDDQMTRSTIDVIVTTEMAHRVLFLAAKLHYRALDSVAENLIGDRSIFSIVCTFDEWYILDANRF